MRKGRNTEIIKSKIGNVDFARFQADVKFGNRLC